MKNSQKLSFDEKKNNILKYPIIYRIICFCFFQFFVFKDLKIGHDFSIVHSGEIAEIVGEFGGQRGGKPSTIQYMDLQSHQFHTQKHRRMDATSLTHSTSTSVFIGLLHPSSACADC